MRSVSLFLVHIQRTRLGMGGCPSVGCSRMREKLRNSGKQQETTCTSALDRSPPQLFGFSAAFVSHTPWIAMDVHSYVQSLARASGSLSSSEVRETFRCAEIGKEVLKCSFQALLSAAAGSPILTSKSADGTPISVVHRVSSALPSGHTVRRSGRSATNSS